MNSQNKIIRLCFCIYYLFVILMYLTSIYKLLILCRIAILLWSEKHKSIFSSILATLLSVAILHVSRAKKDVFLELLNCYKTYKKRRGLRSEGKYSTQSIVVFVTLSICFLIPFLLSTTIAITPVQSEMRSYYDFWLMGYTFQEKDRNEKLAVMICIFAFSAQQIWVPTAVLLFYCNLTFTHADYLETVKMHLKANQLSPESSVAHQSKTHRRVLMEVQRHEKVFSFLTFLVICSVVMIGFTGLALGMEKYETPTLATIFEGYSYLYFSIVGMASVTYSASRIPLQLEDISEFYRKVYDSHLEEERSYQNLIEKRKLKVLKTIYTRKIIHLTAWNIIRLDKNLVFTLFGALLTYGFLILQSEKQ